MAIASFRQAFAKLSTNIYKVYCWYNDGIKYIGYTSVIQLLDLTIV